MKLEKAERLKLQYVNNLQTTTSLNNNIQYSDNKLAEKNYSNLKPLWKESKFPRQTFIQKLVQQMLQSWKKHC